MKKRVLAAAAAIASSAPSFAQSSVTIHGTFDIGLNHTSNREGGSFTEVRSGNTLTSRLGFRGREDLGGGLNALFNLETGFNGDTGTSSSATTFFNRQSWLGLSKDGLGQITVGRQLPTISDVLAPYASTAYFASQAAALDGSATPTGSSAFRFNNLIGGTRIDNAIKLTSADFSGLRLRAMTAPGEGVIGRMDSVGLTYSFGRFDAGIVYHVTRCGPGDCSAEGDKDTIQAVGLAYKPERGGIIGAYVTREKNAKNIRGNDADVLSLLAVYPLNAWSLMAGYQRLDDKTSADQDIQQINLGAKYLLSKRTELYTLFSLQKVDNGGIAGMFSERSSNGRQSQYNIGIRHSF